MAPVTDGRHRSSRSDVRFGVDFRPGQTRRETGTQSQGSSFVKTARLPGVPLHLFGIIRGDFVKAILARFTLAVSLLATLALTLGAGVKWDWWD
jgi:hypothetical protein